MASHSHTSSAAATATATASDEEFFRDDPLLYLIQPLEKKINVEAQASGKEIASSHEETSALVKHNPPSDSTPSAPKDEQIDQPPAADTTMSPTDSQIESPDVLELRACNIVESQPEGQELTEKGQDQHDENKTEQVEPKEAAPVKDFVDIPEKDIKEVVEASDGKEEENHCVESIALEVQEQLSFESAEKEHPKTVGVSQSPDEATTKQAEPVEEHPVKDGSMESAEDESKDTPTKVKSKSTQAETPGVETKLEIQLEVSDRAETAYAEVNKSVSEVEIQQKEKPETTGKADSSQGLEVKPIAKPEDRTVEMQDSVICSKDEKSSDQQKYSSTESPVVLSNQYIVSELKKETEEASSPSEVIEKVNAEEKEKHVVEEPPTDSVVETKDNKENVSEDKDVITKEKPEEGENINRNTEAAGDDKCTETAREIDTEYKEKENATDRPGELDMEKEAAVVTKQKPVENENIKKYTDPAADDKSTETVREIDTELKDKGNAADKPGEFAEAKVAKAAEISTTESSEQRQQPAVTAKEVAVKPKHSNNIISKVKQSFVKAKKAITGKSPSSKNLSTEAKGEIKVK